MRLYVFSAIVLNQMETKVMWGELKKRQNTHTIGLTQSFGFVALLQSKLCIELRKSQFCFVFKIAAPCHARASKMKDGFVARQREDLSLLPLRARCDLKAINASAALFGRKHFSFWVYFRD